MSHESSFVFQADTKCNYKTMVEVVKWIGDNNVDIKTMLIATNYPKNYFDDENNTAFDITIKFNDSESMIKYKLAWS